MDLTVSVKNCNDWEKMRAIQQIVSHEQNMAKRIEELEGNVKKLKEREEALRQKYEEERQTYEEERQKENEERCQREEALEKQIAELLKNQKPRKPSEGGQPRNQNID